MPGNPITGRGGPIGETAIVTEIFQIAYIIITSIIIVKERRGYIRSESKGQRLIIKRRPLFRLTYHF